MRPTLDELPESLDETYERLLKEIKKPNRDHACRLLQCLVVAIRPLRVEELAEVLAIDFNDAEGTPKLNPNWRWEDEEQALLTSCSSLIAIIETGYSRVVQFSHFSVKEFLTSTRLASSIQDISRFHVDLEPAHTILAQACMGILLRTDNSVEGSGIRRSSSLARYAAEHWVKHAQFESVSSFLRKAMENLFDLDKPFFMACLQIYNIDIWHRPELSSLYYFAGPPASSATPLYYAALCGLQDLVEHLSVKHPHHVNTRGGRHVTPVVAALAGRHFQTAKFLHDNGAHLDVCSKDGETVLHSPAYYGDVEMIEVLLGYKVDVNARRKDGFTPLHDAAMNGIRFTRIHDVVQSSLEVARILLEHGADINARSDNALTPLLSAAWDGSVEIVRFLLEHGGDPNARRNDGSIPLHLVAESRHETVSSGKPYHIVRVLLEHGADVAAKDDEGRTPLYRAAQNLSIESVRMLLEHGADLNARTNNNSTPLHAAATKTLDEVLRVLLERGANIGAKDDKGRTPLHTAAKNLNVESALILLECGANVDARDDEGRTPLHAAAEGGRDEVVRMLLNRGANVDGKDDKGRTPLHDAVEKFRDELVRTLLKYGANACAKDYEGITPFQLASVEGDMATLKLLSEYGAKGVPCYMIPTSTSSLCLPG